MCVCVCVRVRVVCVCVCVCVSVLEDCVFCSLRLLLTRPSFTPLYSAPQHLNFSRVGHIACVGEYRTRVQ